MGRWALWLVVTAVIGPVCTVPVFAGEQKDTTKGNLSAEELFDVLCDGGKAGEWTGTMQIAGREVKVSRLTITKFSFCDLCKIPSVRFEFRFAEGYVFPRESRDAGMFNTGLSKNSFSINKHSDGALQMAWGPYPDLVFAECRRQLRGETVLYDIELYYSGGRKGKSITATLSTKGDSASGTVKAKDFPCVEFAFSRVRSSQAGPGPDQAAPKPAKPQ